MRLINYRKNINALNVAEKPSVAATISNLLSMNKYESIPSKSQYNPVFKFDYKIKGEDFKMHFTSVTGHLMEIDFKEKSKWDLDTNKDLFTAQIEKYISPGKEAIADNLTKLAKTNDLLILWLDCDREGENIAFEVVDVVCKANPKIKILRAKFSALTQKDIHESLKNLEPPNKHLSDAVELRQRIDLLIGASFTRLQTICFRNLLKLRNSKFSSNVVSYGPCQFPTLNFVVERASQIEQFEKENFHTLELNLNITNLDNLNKTENKEEDKSKGKKSKSKDILKFEWRRNRLFDKLITQTLYEKVLESGKAEIVDIKSSPVTKNRPVPLNTIEFQKLVSRKLSISSHYAMEIAELLYQKGYISYPRTETQKYAHSEVPQLKKILNLLGEGFGYDWCDYAKNCEFKRPRDGKSDDKSHPPIHPVKFVDKELLEENQRKIYEILVVHFLATVSQNASGEETVVELEAGGETFTTRGLNITNQGYLKIYPYETFNEVTLPQFKKNQIFLINAKTTKSKNKKVKKKQTKKENKNYPTIHLEMKEGKTCPPSNLTEAELITLMDKYGIGTDATIHEHIKTIQDRGYAILKYNKFTPTIPASALIKAYQKIGVELYKPYLRAQMEKEIKEIALGNKDLEQTFKTMKEEMLKIYNLVLDKIPLMSSFITTYLESLGYSIQMDTPKINITLNCRCPECKNNNLKIYSNRRDNRYFIGCSGFPKCYYSLGVLNPSSVTKNDVLCKTCKGDRYDLVYPDEMKTICLSGCLFKEVEDLKNTAIAKKELKNSGNNKKKEEVSQVQKNKKQSFFNLKPTSSNHID